MDHQEAVGYHHQRQMPVQPVPRPPLVVSKSALALSILLELLYGPAAMRQGRQLL